jgi:hypothetical protein
LRTNRKLWRTPNKTGHTVKPPHVQEAQAIHEAELNYHATEVMSGGGDDESSESSDVEYRPDRTELPSDDTDNERRPAPVGNSVSPADSQKSGPPAKKQRRAASSNGNDLAAIIAGVPAAATAAGGANRPSSARAALENLTQAISTQSPRLYCGMTRSLQTNV